MAYRGTATTEIKIATRYMVPSDHRVVEAIEDQRSVIAPLDAWFLGKFFSNQLTWLDPWAMSPDMRPLALSLNKWRAVGCPNSVADSAMGRIRQAGWPALRVLAEADRRKDHDNPPIESPSVLDPPWRVGQIQHALSAKKDRSGVGLVATQQGSSEVLGHAIYRIEKKTICLDRLAVSGAFRRLGIGQALCRKVMMALDPLRRPDLVAIVGESWLAGQLFLRSMGFVCTEVIRTKGGSDAYQFTYHLDVRQS